MYYPGAFWLWPEGVLPAQGLELPEGCLRPERGATIQVEGTWGMCLAASALEERSFDGTAVSGERLLLDRDLQLLEAVTNGDGQPLALEQLQVGPGTVAPYRELVLQGASWQTTGPIVVRGMWRWFEALPDVEQAIMVLVGWLYRGYDQQLMQRRGEQRGSDAGEMPPMVRLLLGPYSRW
ncbi:MAG: phage gp6-like head-tail connector protein [Chloroflexaceae bacterium]|nr:phage gp6-like head-tail connector protein [Chloroflexaceae bacterium]